MVDLYTDATESGFNGDWVSLPIPRRLCVAVRWISVFGMPQSLGHTGLPVTVTHGRPGLYTGQAVPVLPGKAVALLVRLPCHCGMPQSHVGFGEAYVLRYALPG